MDVFKLQRSIPIVIWALSCIYLYKYQGLYQHGDSSLWFKHILMILHCYLGTENSNLTINFQQTNFSHRKNCVWKSKGVLLRTNRYVDGLKTLAQKSFLRPLANLFDFFSYLSHQSLFSVQTIFVSLSPQFPPKKICCISYTLSTLLLEIPIF